MNEILKQIYYLVDENLPYVARDTQMLSALEATLNPEQASLFEAYQEEQSRCENEDREDLFYFTLRIALAINAGDIRTP